MKTNEIIRERRMKKQLQVSLLMDSGNYGNISLMLPAFNCIRPVKTVQNA